MAREREGGEKRARKREKERERESTRRTLACRHRGRDVRHGVSRAIGKCAQSWSRGRAVDGTLWERLGGLGGDDLLPIVSSNFVRLNQFPIGYDGCMEGST